MPMEIFVSCVGDLPTLEESELVVTPACFFPFLFFLFFLFVFFVCLSARRWGMESFILAAPLRCDRVEFLRCDGSKTRGTLTVWTNTRLEHKCICRTFRAFSGYGLLITVCSLPFMLIQHPGLAISPWNRLVFGFAVILSECNLLCSFVFQFTHFISFYSILFYLSFVLFLLYYQQ